MAGSLRGLRMVGASAIRAHSARVDTQGGLASEPAPAGFAGVTHRYPPALPLRLAVGYAVQIGCSQPTCTANPPYAAGRLRSLRMVRASAIRAHSARVDTQGGLASEPAPAGSLA